MSLNKIGFWNPALVIKWYIYTYINTLNYSLCSFYLNILLFGLPFTPFPFIARSAISLNNLKFWPHKLFIFFLKAKTESVKVLQYKINKRSFFFLFFFLEIVETDWASYNEGYFMISNSSNYDVTIDCCLR